MNAVNAGEFASSQLHIVDCHGIGSWRGLSVDSHGANTKVLKRMILIKRDRLSGARDSGWIGESEDQRARRVVVNLADFVFVVAMNVAVKNGNVVVRCDDVHHIVPVAGKPLPIGSQIK